MNLQTLREQGLILFESISGSQGYGLSTPTSDQDIRGVFILPEDMYYGMHYVEQVNDANNDIIFYELGRFFDLLSKNNPNILELTAMPEDCILYMHPLYRAVPDMPVLSRLCRHTFAGYAQAQVEKAHGLNKKIMNPQEPARKTPLDFCYVVEGQGSVPVTDWLAVRGWRQENCGLVVIPHMREVYGLYHDPTGELGYKGIIQGEASNAISLSSVPKGVMPVATLSWNKDGYSVYCKVYREYWEWVEKRNPHRYENTVSHGKNYDSKNMMHTFRLLAMAEEIAREGKLHVRRPDREFLMQVRRGEFEYAELLEMAQARIEQLDARFAVSDLPETPDLVAMNATLVQIRREFYAAHRV